ncbi:40573_t:CDS:2, partial [Gigaspora margarita]
LDNDKEFIAQTIKELIVLWPSVKIIYGRPQHPQSQGLVEQANAMNNSWYKSYKKTSYEIVYSDKPRGNCSLVNKLFANNIFNEKFLSEQSPDHIGLPVSFNYHTGLPVPSPERLVFSLKSLVFLPNNYISYPEPMFLSNNYGSYTVFLFNNNTDYLYVTNFLSLPNKYSGCPVPSPENYVPSPNSPGSPMSSPINLALLPNNYVPSLDSPDDCPMLSPNSSSGCSMPSPNYYMPSPNGYVDCLVPLPDNYVPLSGSYFPVPLPNSSGSCSVSLSDNDLGCSELSPKICNNSKSSPSDYDNDFIRVNIPKIDQFSIDRPILSCNILKKTRENRYKLGCKFGVISVCYSLSKLEALETITYPELNEIPLDKISIREAARL